MNGSVEDVETTTKKAHTKKKKKRNKKSKKKTKKNVKAAGSNYDSILDKIFEGNASDIKKKHKKVERQTSAFDLHFSVALPKAEVDYEIELGEEEEEDPDHVQRSTHKTVAISLEDIQDLNIDQDVEYSSEEEEEEEDDVEFFNDEVNEDGIVSMYDTPDESEKHNTNKEEDEKKNETVGQNPESTENTDLNIEKADIPADETQQPDKIVQSNGICSDDKQAENGEKPAESPEKTAESKEKLSESQEKLEEVKEQTSSKTQGSPYKPSGLSKGRKASKKRPKISYLGGEKRLHSYKFVDWIDKAGEAIKGRLFLTNFRLIFTPQLNYDLHYTVAFGTIAQIQEESDESGVTWFTIIIRGKDFKVSTFRFRKVSYEKQREILANITNLAFPVKVSELFCFTFKHRSSFDGWTLYDPVKEYDRLKLTNSSDWRLVTDANQNYEICSTYPKVFVVPASISNEKLAKIKIPQ
eukprot:TRINITY_DN4613_c0_g2_i1.p1 TRINITY_DN4613_c0_g2~~TRINITY_DN4613_c0_g2_i1.p1  ORF type:complete len:484 (-),score=131.84 TRINITY_DN4613_c0_g2_i1:1424-2827(-)